MLFVAGGQDHSVKNINGTVVYTIPSFARTGAISIIQPNEATYRLLKASI